MLGDEITGVWSDIIPPCSLGCARVWMYVILQLKNNKLVTAPQGGEGKKAAPPRPDRPSSLCTSHGAGRRWSTHHQPDSTSGEETPYLVPAQKRSREVCCVSA